MITKREEFDDTSSIVSVFGDEGETVSVSFPPCFDPMEAHCIASGKFALFHDLKDFNPRSLIRARLYDVGVARLYPRARDAVLCLLDSEQVKLWASCEWNSDQNVVHAVEGPVRDAVAGIPSIDDLVTTADCADIARWYEDLIDPAVVHAIAVDLVAVLREE